MILRRYVGAGEAGYRFHCPACDAPHVVRTEGANAWGFNGDVESPTFVPSIFVNRPIPGMRHPAVPACHSFVTNGRIQFLGDCSHHMAGQTVPLPHMPPRDGE